MFTMLTLVPETALLCNL